MVKVGNSVFLLRGECKYSEGLGVKEGGEGIGVVRVDCVLGWLLEGNQRNIIIDRNDLLTH